MLDINENTSMAELREDHEMSCVYRYLIYSTNDWFIKQYDDNTTPASMEAKNPMCSAKELVHSYKRIQEIIIERGVQGFIYDVYSKAQIDKDVRKKDVKLFYFPAKTTALRDIQKPFVILTSGGGYNVVASFGEAFPVAGRLNELGYTVFCLNYRVNDIVNKSPLFPQPMEDYAAAYGFIEAHCKEFGVDPSNYCIGGFSAGGHLAAMWGVAKSGYKKYAKAAPRMAFLAYAAFSFWESLKIYPDKEKRDLMEMLIGKADASKNDFIPYEVVGNMDETFPASYIGQSELDPMVPFSNSVDMVKKMEESGIPYGYEHHPMIGHGYGLGAHTEFNGWVDRAVEFLESL